MSEDTTKNQDDKSIRDQVASVLANNLLDEQQQLLLIRSITTNLVYLPNNLQLLFAQQQSSNQVLDLIPKTYIPSSKPFVDRVTYINKVCRAVFQNYQNRHDYQTQQNHRFVLIPGASGIGKSRAGEMVAQISEPILEAISNNDTEFINAMKDPIYCYVHLSKGFQYNSFVDSKSPTIRIGSRVAKSQMDKGSDLVSIIQMYNDQLTLGNVLSNLTNNYIKKHPDASCVAIIIHIDEYQLYIDQYDKASKPLPFQESRDFFKDMLREIGSCMMGNSGKEPHKYFVVPICTGTSQSDIHFLPTEYCSIAFNLQPLAREDVESEMISFYLKKNTYLIYTDHFKISLYDTGFIPRYLVRVLVNANEDPINFPSLAYKDMKDSWKSMLSIFATWGDSKDHVINRIISLSISQSNVDLLQVLDGKTLTIDNVRRSGLLFLVKSDNMVDKFKIFIPFMLLKWLNSKVGYRHFAKGMLFLPTPERKWTWMDFEKLYPYYQACLIQSLDKNEVDFQHIFLDVDGTPFLYEWEGSKAQEIIFKSYPTKVLQEVDTILNSNNVQSIKEGNPKTTTISETGSICICSEGTIHIDHRFMLTDEKGKQYLVVVQVKHSKIDVKDDLVGPKFILDWCESVSSYLTSLEDITTILVFFTNRRVFNPDKVLKEFNSKTKFNNKYLVIINKNSLLKFLGRTFVHRGLITMEDQG